MSNGLASKATSNKCRPTHVTGIATDLGLLAGTALSRFFKGASKILDEAEAASVRLLMTLYGGFVLGALVGTVFVYTVSWPPLMPPAIVLGVQGLFALYAPGVWTKK